MLLATINGRDVFARTLLVSYIMNFYNSTDIAISWTNTEILINGIAIYSL